LYFKLDLISYGGFIYRPDMMSSTPHTAVAAGEPLVYSA